MDVGAAAIWRSVRPRSRSAAKEGSGRRRFDMTLDMREFVEDLATSDNTEKGIIDRVAYRVDRLGFDVPEPLMRKGKNYIPKLPSRGVSSLNDEEITDLQAEFVVMMEYAGEQSLIQDVMATAYAVEAKRMKSRVRLKATGTATEKDDKAIIHPKVTDLEDKAAVAKGTFKVINNRYNSFDKARGVLSRDVERRRRDYEGNRRDSSIRGKKRTRGPHRQSSLEPGGKRGR